MPNLEFTSSCILAIQQTLGILQALPSQCSVKWTKAVAKHGCEEEKLEQVENGAYLAPLLQFLCLSDTHMQVLLS